MGKTSYGEYMQASDARHGTTISRFAPRIADVISWGYAVAIILFCLTFTLNFTALGASLAMVLFLLLRAIAHELHKAKATERHASATA